MSSRMPKVVPAPRPSLHRCLAAQSVLLLAVAAAGCSLLDPQAQDPEPCEPSEQRIVLGPTALEKTEPSPAFDVTEDEIAFVTLLGDPNFNEGAGLNGGLVHATVRAITAGEAPRPSSRDDDGVFRSSPDYRIPSFGNVGDSRFLDQPAGGHQLWSPSHAIVEVFTCAAPAEQE